MTKKELCRQIFEDMLNEELLNKSDAFDILSLQKEVEGFIGRHLEDYVLVCKVGIMRD